MFRHLLKSIWRRKSRNLMLSLEIALAFVVVFAVVAFAGRYYQMYRMPLGFEYQDVWSVQMQVAEDGPGAKEDPAVYEGFRRSLKALPEVRGVVFAGSSPFENSTWQTRYYDPASGHTTSSDLLPVGDDFFEVMGMQVERGRWFSARDEGAAQQPAVVNRRFAEALFPGQDPIGKLISQGRPGETDSAQMRVVGVFEDFRNKGEFMAPVPFVLTRFSPHPGGDRMRTMLLRLEPGTPRGFEARLGERLKQVRNDRSYRISPLRDLRSSQLAEQTIPLKMMAVIAAFLLLMVAFGLFGVLWQNTTRRVPEIGLRRAIGATAGGIYVQLVVEQLILCGLAMGAGLLLLVQLPVTRVFGEHLGWPLFLSAAAISVLVMSLVSVLCSVYPAWRASRLSPTQALHYE